jgi:hypothetical protein
MVIINIKGFLVNSLIKHVISTLYKKKIDYCSMKLSIKLGIVTNICPNDIVGVEF